MIIINCLHQSKSLTRRYYSMNTEIGYEIGAFLPGLSKIGRYTSKVTGTLAKAFIPSSIVDAAAKFDPSRKKGLDQAKKSAADLLKPTPAPMVKKTPAFPLTPKVIGIGAAVIGAFILISRGRR